MSSTEGTYDAGTAHEISQFADQVARALAAVSRVAGLVDEPGRAAGHACRALPGAGPGQ